MLKTNEHKSFECQNYDKNKDPTIDICLNCKQSYCIGYCIKTKRNDKKCNT